MVNPVAALAYAERHELHALLIRQGGQTVAAHYAHGHDERTPHALYSGTKSFWGVLAVAAQEDGLLRLDERVAETFPQWNDDAQKATVTLRELLQLTSGFGFGGLGSAVPLYDKALTTPLKHDPGSTFTYGGIPLQVFGAVLARKLAPRGLDPVAYLRERILIPLGIDVASWRTLRDGTHPLPTGAFVTAREWAKYGAFVLAGGEHGGKAIVSRTALAECFAGSAANPRYGLGWWLHPLAEPEVMYASGSGGQAMYLAPSLDLVVVHFGKSASWKHEAFLRQVFAPL